MNKVKLASLIAALFLNTGMADANQADIKFKSGSVLVRCMAPEGHPLITTELFNAAFPHWITAMQAMANEGLITRAHYLGELKEGVFIVVKGNTRDEAKVNASAVMSKINAVTINAFAKTGESAEFDVADACQFIEIGPIAITPIK